MFPPEEYWYPPLPPPGTYCNPWIDWQQDLVANGPLYSVVGWRFLHGSVFRKVNGKEKATDEWLYERYESFLKADYQGDPSRWQTQQPAADLSVRCYMEAAWEFVKKYNFDIPGSIGVPFPYYAFAATAVDSQYRYTLEPSTSGNQLDFDNPIIVTW